MRFEKNIAEIFGGPYFEWLKQQEPLRSTELFAQGSSAMLFQKDGHLYRLTRDGCGHNFLAREAVQGNPQVMRILQDFGAVAPSDEDSLNSGEEFYWLAEVEWLDELDHQETTIQRLIALLEELSEGETLVMEPDLPVLIERCHSMAERFSEFAPLLQTLAKAAHFGADADVSISNIMRRPSTGELVWSDPLFGASYLPDVQRLDRMMAIRREIELGTRELDHSRM
ncbi:hypothetical protein [Pseudomonas sp. BN411]|uniref:hypothetical protein n=1 Tax=Pseudomonas sp. BN411 TaxID=2567887 RepID=UPI002455D0D9|nr:hypothetical protein [Pseudomonas sp. BN411]MDH4562307.1 hypothetical protein [Pseudomonas sp. BN411]